MDSISNLYYSENDKTNHEYINPLLGDDNTRKISQIEDSIRNSLLVNNYKQDKKCDTIFKTLLIIITFGIFVFLGVITYLIITNKL